MSSVLRPSLAALSLGLVFTLGACEQTTPAAVPDAPSSAPAEPPRTASAASPATSPAAALTCLEEVGETKANRLVERCIMVSPATRPPCNVANTCETIQGEIDRGCGFFEPGQKPAECDA